MQNLEAVNEACLQCTACTLCKGRKHVVFGTGSPCAEIMFVGEGPGESEDLLGIPFVGRAGQLLDDMLKMIDLDRSMVYIANIVKCRPPHNRDPLPEERIACRYWLTEQISLINPKIIVCLGRIAATSLIDPNFRITKEHGQWYESYERPTTATFHPAALLRDPGKRPDAFCDLREMRKKAREITRLYEK